MFKFQSATTRLMFTIEKERKKTEEKSVRLNVPWVRARSKKGQITHNKTAVHSNQRAQCV